MFKPVLETGKRTELLKPGAAAAAASSPAGQKLLAAGQYKVSPHRNIKVPPHEEFSYKNLVFCLYLGMFVLSYVLPLDI